MTYDSNGESKIFSDILIFIKSYSKKKKKNVLELSRIDTDFILFFAHKENWKSLCYINVMIVDYYVI
jgi:hypothetical protein